MSRHSGFSALVLAVVGLASACGITPADDESVAESGGCPVVEKVEPLRLAEGDVQESATADNDHVQCEVAYETSPPMSGDHFDAWQNCGFYTRPLLDEVAVHSLEHGVVWVAYSSDLAADELAMIEASVDASSHLMASPYPGLLNPMVLTAWKRQVAATSWSDPDVAVFLSQQLGRMSQTAPEAGASCTGAIGTAPDEPLEGYDEVFAEVDS